MYIFIDENQIIKYNNEILKRYVGDRLIKVISNPSEQDLKEFGYMELVIDEKPTFNPDTQFLISSYEIENGTIHETFTVEDIPQDIDETFISE